MAGGNYHKPQVGRRVSGWPVNSWNKIVDNSRFIDDLRARQGDDALQSMVWQTALNLSGSDISSGCSITGMVGDLPTDVNEYPEAVHSEPTLVISAASSSGVPAIAMGPIKDGDVGEVACPACVVAKVNVTDAGHGFANASFNSAESGPLQIVIKATAATGNQWCLVAFVGNSTSQSGGSAQSNEFFVAKSNDTLNATDAYMQVRSVTDWFGMDPLGTIPDAVTNLYGFHGGDGEYYFVKAGGYANWQPFPTEYKKGDRARHTYRNVDAIFDCVGDHTAGNSISVPLYWRIGEIIGCDVEWAANTAYASGYFVKLTDGIGTVRVYEATSNAGSSPTFDEDDWIFHKIIDSSAFVPQFSYASGDVVKMVDPDDDDDGPEFYWEAQESTSSNSWTSGYIQAPGFPPRWLKLGVHQEGANDWHVAGIAGSHEPQKGVITEYTAATYDANDDKIVFGSLTAHPIKKNGNIDRETSVVKSHEFEFQVDPGTLVKYTRDEVIVIVCDAYDAWDEYGT